jgi:neutral amino acid transport system permease protein
MDWGNILGNAAGELISPTTAAYALAAIGLNIHFGYTGLLNFGQAAFMLVGAYAFAISVLTFGAPLWPRSWHPFCSPSCSVFRR